MLTLNKIEPFASALPNYQVIEIVGADSQKFLQGQLTCDVNVMAENSSTLAAHCDPKGKMNSFFRLVKFSSEQFWFIFETSLLPSALDQLKKYAVFSKVTFRQLDLHIYAFTPEQLPASFSPVQGLQHSDQQTLLYVQAPMQDYYLLLTAQPIAIASDLDAWKALNIVNGYPLFSQHLQGEFIPQALNLQWLEQAISFSKGCYIGQETIARAKYRGANKLALFTLVAQAQETVTLGESVEMRLENGWRRTGTIVNFTHYAQQTWLQVVLNKDLAPDSVFRLSEQGAPFQLLINPQLTETNEN